MRRRANPVINVWLSYIVSLERTTDGIWHWSPFFSADWILFRLKFRLLYIILGLRVIMISVWVSAWCDRIGWLDVKKPITLYGPKEHKHALVHYEGRL